MKKEMSSFDVRAVAGEMASLEGGFMDKIFHSGGNDVLFRINVSGEGKKELYFVDGKWLYLAPDRPDETGNPTSFATFLRKRIYNARIGKTQQIGFDRVLITELSKGEEEFLLVFELFGGGNVLLVSEGKILNCLVHKTRKDRITRPGEDYSVPVPRFDPTVADAASFAEIFMGSGNDAVRTLATAVNLGGQYAEEICFRTGVNKNTPAKDVPQDKIGEMFDAVHSISKTVADGGTPTVYREDGKIVDLAPVPLAMWESPDSESKETLSLCVAAFMAERETQKIKVATDPRLTKMEKRVENQTATIAEYEMESQQFKEMGDAIYSDYSNADELLKVMSQQSKILTWEKLAEGAVKIPFVTAVDPSKNSVTAKLAGIEVPLDYTLGLDSNASALYAKGKEIGEKAKRAKVALDDSLAQLEKMRKGFEKERRLALTRAKPTKQFWFERYKWFITSGGRLAVAGRDAKTNDGIVRKHLKDGDVYAHADIHGAPSVILKDGAKASDEELREVCHFAIAQSKAWVSAFADGSAYWVFPDQVSKTPNAGEFVPRGAFIIRGKRNYEYHLKMEMAVAAFDHEKNMKVMCCPVDSLAGRSSKYYVIAPGRGKGKTKPGDLAKAFDVPEEEISRILPPGDFEVVRKVWPQEEGSGQEN